MGCTPSKSLGAQADRERRSQPLPPSYVIAVKGAEVEIIEETAQDMFYEAGKRQLAAKQFEDAQNEFEMCVKALKKVWECSGTKPWMARDSSSDDGSRRVSNTNLRWMMPPPTPETFNPLKTGFRNLDHYLSVCELLVERESRVMTREMSRGSTTLDALRTLPTLRSDGSGRSSGSQHTLEEDDERRSHPAEDDDDGKTKVSMSTASANSQDVALRELTMFGPNLSKKPRQSNSAGGHSISGCEWDVFLNYRDAADAELAELMYYRLTAIGLRVWWDKKTLSKGGAWFPQLSHGILHSAVFVALVSRGALAPFTELTESSMDNVLFEYTLALELAKHNRLMVLPVLIGDLVRASTVGLGEPMKEFARDGAYRDFFKCGAKPALQPGVVLGSVQTEVLRILSTLSIAPTSTNERDRVPPIIPTLVRGSANQGSTSTSYDGSEPGLDKSPCAMSVDEILDAMLKIHGIKFAGPKHTVLESFRTTVFVACKRRKGEGGAAGLEAPGSVATTPSPAASKVAPQVSIDAPTGTPAIERAHAPVEHRAAEGEAYLMFDSNRSDSDSESSRESIGIWI